MDGTASSTLVASDEPLESLIEDEPAVWDRLAVDVRRATATLADEERRALGEVLYPDLFSEYDARFLSAHVRALDVEFTDAFRAAEAAWECDEELHYRVFRTIYAALFGRSEVELDAEMARRATGVDFAPLEALFADEFTLACLFAYDELATVRAYRANRPSYARLGPESVAVVRRVTADEGRHYRNFFRLIRSHHAHRLGELERVLATIRAHEGIAYANTFVLDHDDDVWSDAIFDASADALRRHLHA